MWNLFVKVWKPLKKFERFENLYNQYQYFFKVYATDLSQLKTIFFTSRPPNDRCTSETSFFFHRKYHFTQSIVDEINASEFLVKSQNFSREYGLNIGSMKTGFLFQIAVYPEHSSIFFPLKTLLFFRDFSTNYVLHVFHIWSNFPHQIFSWIISRLKCTLG